MFTNLSGTSEVNHPENRYPALHKYGNDLTELAKRGKLNPVIGRDDEIQRCIQILCRSTRNYPVITGEPEVGKTAIVEGLAQCIVRCNVPERLLNTKLISLNMGSLLAGTKYRGDIEERLNSVLEEVTASNGQIIVFIDEIHTVVGAGATTGSAVDVGNLLKPVLGRGELHCIGATTVREYGKYIEKDPALERRFQQVYCTQPSVEDTISILRRLRNRFELDHGVEITDSALVSAAVLSDRYITGRLLPDKAIDLVDEAAAIINIEMTSKPAELGELDRVVWELEMERVSIKKGNDKTSQERLRKLDADLDSLKKKQKNLAKQWEQEKSGKSVIREVTDHDIAELVSTWTEISVLNLQQAERDKLLSLEQELHRRVVGQEIAVHSLADVVCRSRVGVSVSDPKHPIATFMFMGPTGVGKKELAKALASCLFDTDNSLVRIDMSEYMEKHTVARLVGPPSGYGGPEEGGHLTEAIRRRPHSIVLFDEIEKADQEVLDILLQVLHDGRLMDSQGRTISFTNCIIIMTTNIGSNYIMETFQNSKDSKEEVYQMMKERMVELAEQTFKPKFMNRIDECIVFQPLDDKQINRVVEIQLMNLVRDMMKQKKIDLHFTEEAVELLGTLGFDPNYGARPVKRVIHKMVETEVARLMFRGDCKEEDSIIVDANLSSPSKDIPLHSKLIIKKADSTKQKADTEIAGALDIQKDYLSSCS